LADIKDRLEPQKGLLVVALPNIFYYKNRWALLWGKFDYTDSGLMDNTHFRWYTFTSAQEMLRQNGFEILKARAEGSFPLGWLRRLLTRQIAGCVDISVSALLPGLFGYQMVIVASPQK
jgi:hypothetical protein